MAVDLLRKEVEGRLAAQQAEVEKSRAAAVAAGGSGGDGPPPGVLAKRLEVVETQLELMIAGAPEEQVGVGLVG